MSGRETISIMLASPGPNISEFGEFLVKSGFRVDGSGFRRRDIYIYPELRPGQETGEIPYTGEVMFVRISTHQAYITAMEMVRCIGERFPIKSAVAPRGIKAAIEQARAEKDTPPDSFEAYDCPMCGTEFGVFYVKGKGYWCSHCDKKAPVPDNPEVLKCVCGETYHIRPYNVEFIKDDALCEKCGHPLFGEGSEAYYLDAYGNRC